VAIGLGVAAVVVAIATVAVAVTNRQADGSSTRVVAVANGKGASLAVSSKPPGARILVDGLETGLETPASIPDRTIGQQVRLALLLDGYLRWEQEVRIDADENHVQASLRRPAPKPTPSPPTETSREPSVEVEADRSIPTREPAKRRRKRGKRNPAPAREPPPQAASTSKGEGRLFLRSTTGWIDVYHGDRFLGTGGLHGVTLPAGRQKLRVVNKQLGVDEIIYVDIKPGRTTHRTVSPGAE
jgi:hypothetical protein